jgi:hypothetical protein
MKKYEMKIFQFLACSTALFILLPDDSILRAIHFVQMEIAAKRLDKHAKFNIAELLNSKSPT